MASVIAVCTSTEKGVSKRPVDEGCLREEYGLEGDAHADSGWHRQVSLLATTSIEKMRQFGLDLKPGDFAENLTVEGMEVFTLPVGTRLRVGKEIILEVSQIGKECHTACAIRRKVGKCIMPVEGVFARVIRGGVVRPGDKIDIEAT